MAVNEQVREITEKLENGMKELYDSDKYAAYLRTMSRFYKYSTRNTLLIHLQNPNATHVASYGAWKNNFNRQVKKGEHGIRIYAPIANRGKEIEVEKVDPVTKMAVLDEHGQPITERLQSTDNLQMRFRLVPIFDIEQTHGDPLPELAETLTGDVERYELFTDALRAVSPLPIEFAELSNADGRCIFGDRIEINTGMSEIQTVCAIIHEITHAKLHDAKLLQDGENPKNRRTEEVEAESVSYAVCQYYGIETSANSFGYLAEWSRGKELKELNASLDTIRKTAAALIDGIDEQYHALAKERGIDLTVSVSRPTAETPQPEREPVTENNILDVYARSTKDLLIGARVLMMPVFDDGNFNRDGKRIYVKVEEPVGKYQLFTQDKDGDEALYFMTASGRIDRTAQYFNDDWDEETRKYVNHRPTEEELDGLIAKVQERFEQDISDPTKWAMYQHAAVLNRLDECETHNIPVRQAREEQDRERRETAAQERADEKRQASEKYDARVNEIAEALGSGKTISVGYDEYAYDGKNPVLDLFKLYGIDLPLRTQGWVNTGLAEINATNYRYYKGKHKGDSTTFSKYLKQLRVAVEDTPIEQLRGTENTQKGVKNTLENKLYEQFAEMFPDFLDKKYSYLRHESDGFEPLSLEWIGGNKVSVMQTYTLEGDLMYDPMIDFVVDREKKTLTAAAYEQSMPPLYQERQEDGTWLSVDGNGNQRTIENTQSGIHGFLERWFENISQQGFSPVRGTMLQSGEEIGVTFDKDGTLIIPDADEPPKLVGKLMFRDTNEVVEYFASDDILAAYESALDTFGADKVSYRTVTDDNLEKKMSVLLENCLLVADMKDDKFYTDSRADLITWAYYNANSHAGGQYVVNNVSCDLILEAAAATKNAESFFDHIGSSCRQRLIDVTDPDFAEFDRNFNNVPCAFIGSTAETMASLIALAKEYEKSLESVPVAIDTDEPEYPYPDTSIAESERDLYGYTKNDIYPLTSNRALELFDADHTIYLLHENNTETMVFDREEIENFDGLFGIERTEWNEWCELKGLTRSENSEPSRESDLLFSREDRFGIYQIPSDDNSMRDYRFASAKELESRGLIVDRKNYELIYTAPLDENATLEGLFLRFNLEHPEDFNGRSLSMSDVIVLNRNGEVTSHYLDRGGYTALQSFTGEEHTSEPPISSLSQVGTRTQPTVAELEADVKAGKTISLMDLARATNAKRQTPTSKARPSLLADLADAKRRVAQAMQPDKNKTNERGHE